MILIAYDTRQHFDYGQFKAALEALRLPRQQFHHVSAVGEIANGMVAGPAEEGGGSENWSHPADPRRTVREKLRGRAAAQLKSAQLMSAQLKSPS